ncbi:MAG: hypothetical protein AMXMBFR64_57840 [Myxococcales bacterium]
MRRALPFAALLGGCGLLPQSGGEWTAVAVIVLVVVVGGAAFAFVSTRRSRKPPER